VTARAYRRLFREKTWHAWIPDAGRSRPLAPRCGRVLALDGRFERGGVPGDPGNPPVCGRPEGHPRPCRSESAVARYRLADLDRHAAARERSHAS
jgi:hypothetical protein